MRMREIMQIVETGEMDEDPETDDKTAAGASYQNRGKSFTAAPETGKKSFDYTVRGKKISGTHDAGDGPSYIARGNKPINTEPEIGTPHTYTNRGKTFTSTTKPGESWTKYR